MPHWYSSKHQKSQNKHPKASNPDTVGISTLYPVRNSKRADGWSLGVCYAMEERLKPKAGIDAKVSATTFSQSSIKGWHPIFTRSGWARRPINACRNCTPLQEERWSKQGAHWSPSHWNCLPQAPNGGFAKNPNRPVQATAHQTKRSDQPKTGHRTEPGAQHYGQTRIQPMWLDIKDFLIDSFLCKLPNSSKISLHGTCHSTAPKWAKKVPKVPL